ncbi:MAG: citrate synthase [Bacteroidia bacterium]|nr:citrate synthase [Bacteroidia bacterium]
MSLATELNETVNIQTGEQNSSYPVVTGTYNEKGITIDKLRDTTGYVTLDVGFKNTGSTESTITFIDGEAGILEHSGYRIEELASKSSFEEVMWLLLHGELPSEAELAGFSKQLKAHRALPVGVKGILDALPDQTHPMGMLAVVLNSLSGFYPAYDDSWKSEEVKWNTIYTLLANMPGITAYIYRRSQKLPYIDADPSLGYVENFLHMMFGKVDERVVEALDRLLILHADHEQNCSASTVRFVGSSRVNLFAAVAAGSNALWGPLHGGANQAVLEMLEAIQLDGGNVDKYIAKAKDKADPFRLMGFGHRVYKNFDPRAAVIKKYVDQVLDTLEKEDPVVDIAKGLEREALKDEYFSSRKLFPNVDFYSGIIYRALGIPVSLFTVMFALGRMPGWIAQWKEMRQNGEPIGRPRQIYTGAATRAYVPMSER